MFFGVPSHGVWVGMSGTISIRNVGGLIAAAGTGSRAGLPYPKTLHAVRGTPILGRILDLLAPHDACPTVIVSPSGRQPIADYLARSEHAAHLVVQAAPRGMGDAVLCLDDSPAARDDGHVVLIWGDIPLLSAATLEQTLDRHFAEAADLTFPTRIVDRAYTMVSRDADGDVVALAETRELGVEPGPGERDVGLFVFRKSPIFRLLRADAPERVGGGTGEHGFLYVVALAAAAGLKVTALPIATECDLVSLNHLADLDGVG